MALMTRPHDKTANSGSFVWKDFVEPKIVCRDCGAVATSNGSPKGQPVVYVKCENCRTRGKARRAN
jgi:hypothetical protein